MSSDFDRSRDSKLVVGIHASSQKSGAILAILIIAAGVILLLNQMGVLPRNFVATYWPVILVLGGLALTFTTRQTENRLWGGALVVAGIILLLNRLGVTHLAMRNLWPLFIILVGVALLLAAMKSPNFPGAKVEDGSAEGRPQFTSLYIFAGAERKINSRNFTGAQVSAIFGGFELDFTHADIEGDRAMLEVNAIFGGGEVTVPENWVVVVEGTGIFGGFEDKTRHFQPDPSKPSRTLVVKGSAIFGGISIKNP